MPRRYGVLCTKENCEVPHDKGRFFDGTATVEKHEEKAAKFEAKMRRKVGARNQNVTLAEYCSFEVVF